MSKKPKKKKVLGSKSYYFPPPISNYRLNEIMAGVKPYLNYSARAVENKTIISNAGFFSYDIEDIAQCLFFESLLSKLTVTSLTQPEAKNPENLDYLYVYDIDDINELTIDEIKIVWKNRDYLCGSIEVAAEILSIITYIDNDEEDTLYPYTSYLDYEEILSLSNHINKIQPLNMVASSSNIAKTDFDKSDFSYTHNQYIDNKSNTTERAPELSLNDIWISQIDEVSTLDEESLKYIWKNILEHCEFIELASAIYARLRFIQGYDTIERDWAFYINSPSISQFKDQLPSYNHSSQFDDVSILLVNKKEKSLKYTTSRTNQTDFRTSLIARYSGTCCITKCAELSIVEAAHIIPYMGNHSNLIDNGLLLRVDIHRLFDRYLITINSDTHRVVVSDEINDKYYQEFDGKEIYIPRTSDTFLKKHNDAFNKNITKT